MSRKDALVIFKNWRISYRSVGYIFFGDLKPRLLQQFKLRHFKSAVLNSTSHKSKMEKFSGYYWVRINSVWLLILGYMSIKFIWINFSSTCIIESSPAEVMSCLVSNPYKNYFKLQLIVSCCILKRNRTLDLVKLDWMGHWTTSITNSSWPAYICSSHRFY